MRETYAWSHDGERIVLGWETSGSETLTIRYVQRVPEHTDNHEFMFLGQDAIARHCQRAVRTMMKTAICEIMMNREKDPNKKKSWQDNYAMYANQGERDKLAAKTSAASDMTGKARIRQTFP